MWPCTITVCCAAQSEHNFTTNYYIDIPMAERSDLRYEGRVECLSVATPVQLTFGTAQRVSADEYIKKSFSLQWLQPQQFFYNS